MNPLPNPLHGDWDEMPAHPAPAEACTELGAETAPVYRLGLFTLIRLWFIRWNLQCLRDERDYYTALGLTGPVYMRNSFAEDRRLMARIRQLEQP